MKVQAVFAIGIFCSYASTAHAIRWVGPATTSGDILQPQSYKDAVAGLYLVSHDFENLTPGSNVALQNFGMFWMVNSPYASTSLIAKSGVVAGTIPASGNMALHITQAPSQPTGLTIETSEPVLGMGFALMGLESAAWLSVFGGEDGSELLGRYSIAAVPQAGLRRWIGIAEDSRIIRKVKIEPTQAEDYAIDDVQIGVHAPEPSMLIAWVLLPLVCSRIRRHPGQGV